MYQDLIPIQELGPHPGIYLVTPTHVKLGASFPDYIRLTLICTTLSHRINRIRNESQHGPLVKSFYHYRGIIIRSLMENIQGGDNHTIDMLVAGIIALLLSDVGLMVYLIIITHTKGHTTQAHQGASPNWRCHLEGVHNLVTLRGGVRSLSDTRSLDQLLLFFMLYVTSSGKLGI